MMNEEKGNGVAGIFASVAFPLVGSVAFPVRCSSGASCALVLGAWVAEVSPEPSEAPGGPCSLLS